jgi:hypothetical protein
MAMLLLIWIAGAVGGIGSQMSSAFQMVKVVMRHLANGSTMFWANSTAGVSRTICQSWHILVCPMGSEASMIFQRLSTGQLCGTASAISESTLVIWADWREHRKRTGVWLRTSLHHTSMLAICSHCVVRFVCGGSRFYADSAYTENILADRDKLLKVYRKALAWKSDGQDRPILQDRLMYGSDWSLAMRENNMQSYLADFIWMYSQLDAEMSPLGETLSDKFFGDNVVHYLGLRDGRTHATTP